MISDVIEGTGGSVDLPALPEAVEAERLQAMGDAELDVIAGELNAATRSVTAAMAPYEAQLREIRARLGQLSTERRRRERAAHVQQRAAVRQQAKSGEMPSVADALDSAAALFDDSTSLQNVAAFLATGGEVGFGFATRPGTITFTDGRQQRQATTWGDARELYRMGWEPGTPGIAGVRVHLRGTRVERVVGADEVVVQPG